MTGRRWLVTLLALGLLGACAMPPPTRPRPDPFSGPASPASRRTPTDAEIARKAAELRSLAAERFEDQKRRVERVGRRLLETIPGRPRVQFAIVDGDPSINAGATFGQVVVTSGMLNFVHSDDEMAMVLGHELAHIQQGHVMKGAMSSLALNVLAIVLDARAPGAGQAAGGIGQLFLNRFSQSQEREADDVGLRYAYGAGYDPRAAIDVQERLAVQVPQSMSAGYFDTHPSSVERAVAARLEAEELLAGGEPPGRREVLALERADRPARRSRLSARTSAVDLDDPDTESMPPARQRRNRVGSRHVSGAEGSSGRTTDVAEDCDRAAIYAEMAADARAADERALLYRRAYRYCPSLADARPELSGGSAGDDSPADAY